MLTLKARVLGGNVDFLVDSGASNNFVSAQQMKRLGLVVHEGPRARVRLADGSVLSTSKYAKVVVDFGGVQAFLQFTILDVECPSILGMPFLRCVNPAIDWQTCKVTFPKSGGSSSGFAHTNRFHCLNVEEVVQQSVADHKSYVKPLEPIGQATPGDSCQQDNTCSGLVQQCPGSMLHSSHCEPVSRDKGVKGQSECNTIKPVHNSGSDSLPSSLIRNDGNRYQAFVKAVGKPLTFDQLLEQLPFEAIDDCIDCGGVEKCARQLKQQVGGQYNLTSLRCSTCGVAHMCVGECSRKHVCGGKACGSRFARVEENLVANPLARYYDLVLRVKGSELECGGSGNECLAQV